MILSFCALLLPLPASAGEDFNSSGPYCGLYCVHAAAHAHNIACEFEPLIDQSYLTGTYGSSSDDLCRALSDNGLRGKVVDNLSSSTLRMADTPVILHIRVPGSDTGYHHWVLFLGFDGAQARIYDPPHSICTISFEELLSIWDGVGIITSVPGEDSGWSIDIPFEWLLLVALAAALIYCLQNSRKRWASLLIVTVTLVLVRHLLLPGGFAGSRQALDNVAEAHFHLTPEIIDYEQLEAASHTTDVTIIDARLPADYRSEHIPGAINVPVAISFSALKEAIATIPSDRLVVVYCQSERCTWSDSVANHLLARGYPRVCIYRNGMNDWKKQRKMRENDDSNTAETVK